MQDFAEEVPKAIASGENIQAYIASSQSFSPEKRLAQHYRKLLADWHYLPDPPGYDHFRNAASLIKSAQFEGDCEDFAIVMLSICHAIQLQCQIVLGQKNNRGHIWTEVLITRSSLIASTKTKINKAFGSSVDHVQRSNGYWLQLSPNGSLKQYTTTHTINDQGQLTTVINSKLPQ